MLLSSIKMLLHSEITATNFKFLIQHEISEYKKLFGKKGASRPVYLTQDIVYKISKTDVKNLIKLKNMNELDKIEASYIADALLMSEKTIFEEELLRDELEAVVET